MAEAWLEELSYDECLDLLRAWLVIVLFSVTGRRLHAAEGSWPFHPSAYL